MTTKTEEWKAAAASARSFIATTERRVEAGGLSKAEARTILADVRVMDERLKDMLAEIDSRSI